MDTLREVLGGGGGSFLLPDGNPFSLHFAMFLPTIMGQVREFPILRELSDRGCVAHFAVCFNV